MSSGLAISTPSQSFPFPRARIRILSTSSVEKVTYDVVLAVSHRVYWKVVEGEKKFYPLSLFDFRKESSLELKRLDGAVTWEVVENTVEPEDTYGPSFIVPGYLRGRARWNVFSGNVRIVFTMRNLEERNKWMHEFRLRVAPWELLHRRARSLMADVSEEMSIDELSRQMEALLIGKVGHSQIVNSSVPAEVVDRFPSVSSTTKFHERIRKMGWLEKLNLHFSSLASIVAKAVRRETEKSEELVNTLQDVEVITKLIPGGLSSIFHLVVLGARLASMFAEADRGRNVLPRLLVKVGEFLECVTESVAPILQSTSSSTKGATVLEGSLFEVLVTILDLMGRIEEQLMRSWQGQVFSAHVVKEVESELGSLKAMVLSVVHAKDARDVKREVVALAKKIDTSNELGTLLPRPRKSHYFVGRSTEARQLKKIVQNHGSAAITGYGGLGKSQLMTAFADEAEVDGDVPGGVFWIVADGNTANVVEALAQFIERLRGTSIPKQDRKQPGIVASLLKKVLSERNGRWLLCIDNVDNANDANVRGILDEVASIAEAALGDGWVLVTSRCGEPTLWTGMQESQNVVLGPLSAEDAMYVLWRYKESMRCDEIDDETISKALICFRTENEEEYQALYELCGYGYQRSLAGLPLALIHAGAYIRRFKCPFSEYLELYREAIGKSELEELFLKVEDIGLKEEQRAILTTWSISMSRLSDDACRIIRAVSMLGNAWIPEDLMKEIVKEDGDKRRTQIRRFHKLVLDELVSDSSLLRQFRNEAEASFEIHPLIRLFILVDMEPDSVLRQNAFDQAVIGTHFCVDAVLKEHGKLCGDFPNLYEDRQFVFFPHALSLVNHSRSPSAAMPQFEKVVNLYKFARAMLYWTQALNEAFHVEENLLKLYYAAHGAKVENQNIAESLHMLAQILNSQGKLGESETKHREALAMQYSIFGEDGVRTGIATSLKNLGNLLRRQGKLDDAEMILRKSLAMNHSIHGQDAAHSDAADSINSLAHVLRMQGKLDEAETMNRKALDLRYSIHGENQAHSDIAYSINYLALVLERQGKLDEAEALHRKALDMRYTIRGKDYGHGSIAYSINNLALVLERKGELDEAERLLRKALAMQYSFHGKEAVHSDIAFSLCKLGPVLAKQGKSEEAEKMLREALAMKYSIHGGNVENIEIADTQRSLAEVLSRKNS